MSNSTQPGQWDGPWYRVRTEHFEAAFLPNAGEDLESVDNVDVFVDLMDGSRWSATIITLGQVEVVMAGWAESGEALHDNIEAVHAQLTPRAQLAVRPDLLTDVDTATASLPDEGLVEIIWEGADGRITSTVADETQFQAVASRITDACAAGVVSLTTDERHPLFTAVLPDSDGVLRARRQTEPTPSDRDWAFLKTPRRGQVVTGTVTSIASFGVTFVDISGFTAMTNIPELSWRPFNHPSDVVSVGQEITAEVLDVGMVWERVPLSLRAVQDDPWPQAAQRIGQTVTGPVTEVMPFGVFVRIEDREDGFQGLVHTSELDESPGEAIEVGDVLTVKIIEVGLPRRRVALSQRQADQ